MSDRLVLGRDSSIDKQASWIDGQRNSRRGSEASQTARRGRTLAGDWTRSWSVLPTLPTRGGHFGVARTVERGTVWASALYGARPARSRALDDALIVDSSIEPSTISAETIVVIGRILLRH